MKFAKSEGFQKSKYKLFLFFLSFLQFVVDDVKNEKENENENENENTKAV